MELQNREGRNNSIKLEFEEYLRKETKTRKKTKGQPPLPLQQDASMYDAYVGIKTLCARS